MFGAEGLVGAVRALMTAVFTRSYRYWRCHEASMWLVCSALPRADSMWQMSLDY